MSSAKPYRRGARPNAGQRGVARPPRRSVRAQLVEDSSSPGVKKTPRRVDTDAADRSEPSVIRRVDRSHPNCDASVEGAESWLSMQSADLVDRLQDWALELEAREAAVTAREARLAAVEASQQHRDRAFRAWDRRFQRRLAAHQRAIAALLGRLDRETRPDA